LRIRNLENADDGHDGKNETVWMIVGIVGVVLMIGIGVFILLRLNDDGEREEDNEKDNERDFELSKLGIKVLRYTNKSINNNFNDVCNNILKHLGFTWNDVK
jgi:hypothetical protein